ncbi:PAS domain-containing sensor histidine kinase [Nonomuraea ferruginea]|uniref:histidine kinase n=1 Tax=Nonomuraea ferruginea TaxID=46174 RepID=A0ABT4SQL0_9ACTN|nr:PAS domain-containing sensor histidine kinase [Nonomuraea ferruginea]MDA0639548.1 PAS domain-containing sensor histidine kinase [Nonomuraea ferruginea]
MGAKLDYAAVFDAIPTPCTVVTPDLVIVAVNDACLRATRRTREEVVGRSILTAFASPPGFVEALRTSLEQVTSTGEVDVIPLVRHDVEAERRGELEEHHWNLVHVPVFDRDRRLSWIMCWAEDITPLLGAAPDARDDGDELEPHIHRRARDLVELSSRLKQAYRQEQQTVSALHEAIEHQQRFLFDATHDLRNPITGLMTELEVALTESDAGMHPTLRKLHRDVERLDAIVGDLLALARLYTATPPATDRVDLGRLVVQELEEHPPSGEVITRLDPGVVVRASRVRLARVLSNLVANAERHTTSKIEIVVTADPPSAFLEVIDDGPGIPPADREKVFHRMYRRADARAKDPRGSGFGLAIGREIAQAYGGDLYVADHPGGARLVLRLPLAQAQS